MLTVLHISDLHFSAKNDDQTNFIRDCFLNDIKKMVARHGRPERVIFSGDLVNDPDEADVYVKLIDEFVSPLENHTGVPARSVIFCPGNHDISFSAIKRNSISFDGLRASAGDPNLISGLYKNGQLTDYAHSVSEKFFEFCDYVDSKWSNPFFKVFEDGIGGKVIALNAAFGGSTQGSPADRGKLVFPVAAWDEAHRVAGGGQVLATVLHFPLGELNEPHARELRSKIAAASRMVFFGHLHEPLPEGVTSVAGSTAYLQSGALYEKRERFKGYSYVSVEGELAMARFRTFYDTRRIFDEATNVGPRGVFYLGPDSEAFFKSQSPSYSREQLDTHLRTTVAPEVRAEIERALSGDKLTDSYVAPYFGEQDKARVDESGEAVEETRKLADIQSGDDHICLQFPDETGATSFLLFVAHLFASQPETFARPRIPIYVDLREVRATYKPAVERMVKAGYPSIDHTLFGLKARTEDQPFVILVDNYEPSKSEHVEWMQQITDLYPQARYLICVKSPFAKVSTLRTMSDLRLQIGHRNWRLYPFDRKQVRALVNKFSLPDNINKNVVVEEVFSKFRAMGIPLSGPIVAMYLTVIRDRKKYSPVNTAAMYENFLEISLDKRKTVVVFQDDFDYREQVNLLSVVAKHFVAGGVESSSYEEFYALIENHYRVVGIRRDAAKIVQFFCDKGILENVTNRIQFKYGMIFSYLIALRISTDQEFRSYVLAPQNIHRFISELDIYFSINRNDVSSLETIAQTYDQLLSVMENEFGSFFDAKVAEQLELPREEKFQQFIEVVAERIADQAEGDQPEQRDETVHVKKDTPNQFIQKFKRPESQKSLVQWVKVLACYSVCLKNSEDLSKDLKEEHIERIFRGWERLTGFSVAIVALLLDEGSVEIGEHKFDFRAKSITDPKIVRGIIASVPRYVSYFAGLYLASGKLELALRKLNLDGFADFLRVGMLVDMRVDAFLHEIEGFQKRTAGKNILLESMLWKLRDSFLRIGLERGYVESFQARIVDLHADILGLRGPERETRVAAMLRKLSELRLLRKIKTGQ